MTPDPPPPDAPPRRLTAADFDRLPDCRGLELVDGAVVRRPPEPLLHAALRTWQVVAIGNAAEADPSVHGAVGVHVLCPGGNIRTSGAAAFDRRRPADDGDSDTALAPRLSMHVDNPAEPAAVRAARRADLFAAGTLSVAELDVRERTLSVFAADGRVTRLGAADTFTPGPPLPTLSAPVADFFRR